MTTIEDFIRLSKSDAHNNLDLGMRYPTYVMWAGFYVPEFPQDGSAVSPDLARTVKEFTQTRVETEADIANLLTLSLNEADADKCTKITATFNNLLMKACDTPENFVSVIDSVFKKFSNRIQINPILAIDTDNIDMSTFAVASSLLGSGLFTGIYVYGDMMFKTPQRFASFVKTAKEHNLTTEIAASYIKSSDAYMNLLRTFVPDVMIQGESAAKDPRAITFMKDNDISVVVTPNLGFGEQKMDMEQKAKYVRAFLDAGITVKAGTESVLLLNKSLSQFAADLCNTGVFTANEVKELF